MNNVFRTVCIELLCTNDSSPLNYRCVSVCEMHENKTQIDLGIIFAHAWKINHVRKHNSTYMCKSHDVCRTCFMRAETLNIFPSQPMHIGPFPKVRTSLDLVSFQPLTTTHASRSVPSYMHFIIPLFLYICRAPWLLLQLPQQQRHRSLALPRTRRRRRR